MRGIVSIIALLALATGPVLANTITYQGQLEQSGSAFDGSANLDFRLFDAASAGNRIGDIQEQPNTIVSNGQFQVELDFGSGAFDGSPRYLEIRVNGTLITPRQPVRATPQALVATTTVSGAIGTSQINPAQVQRRVVGSCPAGQYIRAVSENGAVSCGSEPPAWRLGGNAGTDSSSDFIGTTDAEPLELRVANVRGLRIEPSELLFDDLPVTANVIAGSHSNEVTEGVRGATIAGGGVPTEASEPALTLSSPNRVTDFYGTVSGGYGNQAGDGEGTLFDQAFATVGGGQKNSASGFSSTVSGGSENIASGLRSTVSGGSENIASGSRSTVSGGAENTASGRWSSVGGGWSNTSSGDRSVVAGGNNNTASGLWSTVSGGVGNCAGGKHSWAGGRGAKVRGGTESGAPGSGCALTPVLDNAVGDEGTFVWSDAAAGLNFVSTGSNQFLIRSRGGMGINTNAPTAALDVQASPDRAVPFRARNASGDILFTVGSTGRLIIGDFSSGGTSVCRTNTTNILSNCSSSLRYKDKITPLDGNEALDLLSALRPVRYHWLDDGRADIGMVAEEVAELMPEIVTYNQDGTVEGFEYNRLGPLLIAGFQEQTAANAERFAALETDHQRLATENAELRAEVAVLKVQSGQVRELERRLAVMEARERENDDLRARLAALEAVLLDHGQIARTER